LKKAIEILAEFKNATNLTPEQKEELDLLISYISKQDKKNNFKIDRLLQDKKITQNYLNISIKELEDANDKVLKVNSQLVVTNEKSKKNVTRLAEVNKNLGYLLNQQHIQSKISSHLKDIANLDKNINRVLKMIGNHTNVSRIYIYEDITKSITKNTYEWHHKDFEPNIQYFQELKYNSIPKWRSMLIKDGQVFTNDTDELSGILKEKIKKNSIKSILAYPLYIERKYMGFIGFDECTKKRNWTEEEANLLHTTSNIISNAFERRLFINKLKRKNIELKKSYGDIEIKNNKLNESIEELEEFAYITTHDLKQPLRTILNFVHLFSISKQHLLDDEAKLFLKFISDSSTRLDNLINDMLNHSVIGKTGGTKEWIEVGKLIDHVISDLNAQIQESNAQIEYKDLPKINGFRSELNSLFQNLISNAIKYSKQDEKPNIEISYSSKDNDWVFSIKDNGIGFDPKFNNKIFSIFQRLENASNISGTGIGLAHCKKIVELHGGKIWAESEPAKGSTFFFTLPKFES